MNFRKNKIFVLLVAVALLLLFVGAVSASDNTNYDTKKVIKEKQLTKPIPCKVKTKSITAYTNKPKKSISYIRDNKNKPVKNARLLITEIHNRHNHSFISFADNKGRYVDSTSNFEVGKTKVIITSADNKYKFSGSFFINIKKKKYVIKNIYFPTYNQRDYFKKIGKHSYLDCYFDDDNYRYYVDLLSKDKYKFKTVVTFWQKLNQYGYYGKIVKQAYSCFSGPIGEQTFSIKDNYGHYNLIGLRVYYIK